MQAKKIYKGWYVLPAFLIFFVLFLLPSIIGLFFSFTNWNVMSDNIRFIGLENYRKIFMDKGMWKVFGNNAFYAVVTSVFKGAFGLILAVALNRAIKTRNALRTIFFLPMIISNLIVGLVFQQILHPDHGILNLILETMGLGMLAQNWLIDPKVVMWSCAAIEIWKAAGFNMIIFLAGLQGVPQDICEASDIDGANGWQKFARVIFPLMLPSVVINMLLNVISGLKVFDVIFTLTNGGPGRASEVINITIFRQFSMGDYGYGTALNTILFVVLSIISVVVIQNYTKEDES